jgi:L-lactate dehydrogenase complex protein LldE
LRGLRNGKSSELAGKDSSKARTLLSSLKDIHLVDLDRRDECCGFGGTFSVFEEAVSAQMGKDRIHDHEKNGAEIITATDMSCLMHLEGLIKRNQQPLRVMHIAEILNTAIS